MKQQQRMMILTDPTKFNRSKEEWTLRADGGLLSCWRQTVRKRGSIQDGKTPCWSGMKWLEKMKKEKDKRSDRQKVTQMIQSAEGSAGPLHKISKPWRGGAQILKEEEDVCLLDRCEAKRKEWSPKHWQCNG